MVPFAVVPGRVTSHFFLSLAVSVFEKVSSPVSIKAVEWMEYVFAKATVIMNLCSLEKKINLNSLMQKFIKKKLD